MEQDILTTIIAHKREEVEAQKRLLPPERLAEIAKRCIGQSDGRSLKQALATSPTRLPVRSSSAARRIFISVKYRDTPIPAYLVKIFLRLERLIRQSTAISPALSCSLMCSRRTLTISA